VIKGFCFYLGGQEAEEQEGGEDFLTVDWDTLAVLTPLPALNAPNIDVVAGHGAGVGVSWSMTFSA